MATKSIGTLKAFLSLDPSGFLIGFAKAKGAVAGAVSGKGGIASAIAGMAKSSIAGFAGVSAAAGPMAIAVAASAAAVTASYLAMHKSFERIDRQAKLAERLGITYDSLQRLSVGARLSGADVELLAKSMLNMGRTIGSGGKALDVRFFEVADAIAKIEDPAMRAKRATDVFGKGGMELLNAIGKGSGKLKEAATLVDRFGLSLSALDVSRVEAANDSLGKLGIIAEGLQDKFMSQFAPAVETAVERAILAFEKGSKAMAKSWLGQLITNMGTRGITTSIIGTNKVFDAFGVPRTESAATGAAPGNNRTPDLFADAAKQKPLRPGAFEFNTVEAARAITAAGGDATGGVVTELKNILRTIQILSDDVRRETAAKDGFLIREGKI